MTIEAGYLTGEDLLSLGRTTPCELVRGKLQDMTPPGEEHGEISVNTAALLITHVRRHKLGKVVVESGFYTQRNPDTVRAPDVSFFSQARLGPEGLPKGYGVIAPDLAVEVVSPNDTAQDVETRVLEMLAAGVKRVWVLFPGTRTVHVYAQGGHVRVLHDYDTLAGEDVVPDFECPVSDLFDLQD